MEREDRDAFWNQVCLTPPEERSEAQAAQAVRDFANPLRGWLLKHKQGPGLDEHEIDEVVDDALMDFWQQYDPRISSNPYAYLMMVAKTEAIDRLRRFAAKKHAILNAAREFDGLALINSMACPKPGPLAIIEGEELDRENSTRLRAINSVLSRLTERERIAFDARFSHRADRGWTRTIIERHGKDARYWRKASDDALERIRGAIVAEQFLAKTQGGTPDARSA